MSKDDRRRDESWNFAPVGVLSHVERDTVNMLQARAFAAHHGLLLIRWRLPLCGANALTLDGSEESELYDHEAAGFWGYFVVGAPGILNDNLAVALKLANGTHVTMHSLTMPEECEGLDELIDGLEEGATELELPMPPKSINVVPHSLTPEQRKALLRRGLAWQDVSGEPIVPILLARESEAVATTSLWAATEGIPTSLMVRKHAATLAFALTDYKWQGKTVARLLISLRGRRFKPSLSLTSFYTMRTRTRRGADQRTVGFDPRDESDRDRLRELRHPAALRIWNGAYDREGRWSDERAAALAAAIVASQRGRSSHKRPRPEPAVDTAAAGYAGDVDMNIDPDDGDEDMD